MRAGSKSVTVDLQSKQGHATITRSRRTGCCSETERAKSCSWDGTMTKYVSDSRPLYTVQHTEGDVCGDFAEYVSYRHRKQRRC